MIKHWSLIALAVENFRSEDKKCSEHSVEDWVQHDILLNNETHWNTADLSQVTSARRQNSGISDVKSNKYAWACGCMCNTACKLRHRKHWNLKRHQCWMKVKWCWETDRLVWCAVKYTSELTITVHTEVVQSSVINWKGVVVNNIYTTHMTFEALKLNLTMG